MTTNQQAAAAVLMMGMVAHCASDPVRVILSRIVEADRAAMEANDLLTMGVIDHARYEAAAQARDEAIEAAAAFLGVEQEESR